MNAIKSTPFSFLTAKEFDALEGFMWLLVHGNNTMTEQTFLLTMVKKLIHPLSLTFIVHVQDYISREREIRTYPNGKPPLLTE